MGDREGKAGRRRASLVLAVVGALLLLFGGVLLYAGHAIFDSEQFASRASDALKDERVRAPLAEALVDGLIENAEPDLVNARPILVSASQAIIGTEAFRSVFRQAAERAHRTLFTRERDNLVLNLADGAAVAIGAVQALAPKIADEIPADVEPRLNDIVSSDFAIGFVQFAESVRIAGFVLPLVGIVLLVGAVAIDRDRRRSLLRVAVALAAAAAVALALLLVGRVLILGRLDSELRDAGAAVWDAYLGDLLLWFIAVLVASIVLAAAVTTRRRVDPLDPLRRFAERAGQVPASGWGQALRAALVLVVGVAIVASPDAFVRLVAVFAGAYAIFYALSELLLLIAPPPVEDADAAGVPLRERIRWRPAIATVAVIAGVTILVIVLVGGREGRGLARAAAEIERCNGFAELCDRRLNEVVFPAVHNAMSSAADDYVTPNNRKAIPDQLEAGVRTLLIDAHWGRRVDDKGIVVTDLKAEGGEDKAREAAIEATSEEFVEAAERLIQRQALGKVEGGKLGVYFCHVFCELGSTPAVKLLSEVTEFLDTHPDEVVLLVIEDYVPPEEIEKAVEESGLIDYVYTPRRDRPLPTLRQLIASGKRAVMMAENNGGGEKIPWYAQAFEYSQETPYTFHSAEELAAKSSCDRNRGGPNNPLFQVNHWVEKVPRSPKLAAKVNAYKFLLDRARLCARERGILPTWLAVDFWEEGDLFEVAQSLNELGRDAQPEYSESN